MTIVWIIVIKFYFRVSTNLLICLLVSKFSRCFHCFENTFIHRWRWLPCKVPIGTSGDVWGSITCPRALWHADQGIRISNIWKQDGGSTPEHSLLENVHYFFIMKKVLKWNAEVQCDHMSTNCFSSDIFFPVNTWFSEEILLCHFTSTLHIPPLWSKHCNRIYYHPHRGVSRFTEYL